MNPRSIFFTLFLLVGAPTIGQATIVGFGQLGGSNTSVPSTLASKASDDGNGYSVSNGTTPNISLIWDSAWDIHTSSWFDDLEELSAGGGAWDKEDDSPRVGQLDSGSHTITFTAEPGYALVLDSFDLCHTSESSGTTVWNLTLTDASFTTVWSQTVTLDNSDTDDSVITVSPNFTGALGESYTLAFNRQSQTYSSNGRHAIDNLSFRQAPAGGEPAQDPILDPTTELSDLVNTMVGVAGGNGTGSCVLGACLPQASIYPSPDTQEAAAGGFSPGSPVVGFSQTHVSGTGSSTMSFGNFLVSPRLGEGITEESHASSLSDVTARPYSFRGKLTTWDTECTVVPTANCAIYEFDFPASDDARLNFDIARKLRSTTAMTQGSITIDPATGSIYGGGTFDGNWNPASYNLYFYAKVDTSPVSGGTFIGSNSQDGVLTASITERERLGGWMRFNTTSSRTVRMKIAVSFNSVERAQQYLENEIPAWDLTGLEAAAKTQWNDRLSAVQTPGIKTSEAVRLYTALFHSFIQPRNRTGDPAGWPSDAPFWDEQYTLWDTWQTHFPLLTMVSPDTAAAIVNSFAERFERNGRAETAFIQGKDFQVGQGGDEVDRVICDAYVKNIPGIDWEQVWPLLEFNASRRTDDYRNLGFVSTDGSRGNYDWRMSSGSSTIAFAHGDWCAAQVAAGLGHTEEAASLLTRSQNWRKVWDPNATGDGFSGFIQGRARNGEFQSSSATSSSNFYQGTPWNYSFSIPHDQDGAIELMGGRARFLQRLEHAFSQDDTAYVDFSNEVNLKATALYGHAKRPYLQSYWANVLRQRFGALTYPGDEDSGAMSSTYFFVTAGIFPSATEDIYYLSGPRVPRLEFHELGEEQPFTITAENAGGENIYIQSVTLNGQTLTSPIIHHSDMVAGGTLAFVMGPHPCSWGTGSDFQAPVQRDRVEPVSQPWTAALGNPAIQHPDSASVLWGEGPDGADHSAIYSEFPDATLTQPGDQITLTAIVNLQGLASPSNPPSDGIAWGLFHADESNSTKWPGYLAATDTTDDNGTRHFWKHASGTNEPYYSTNGADPLTSFTLATADFTDGSYRMILTLARKANGALDHYAALVSTSDEALIAAFSGSDTDPDTYTFNRIGLRLGDSMDADSLTLTDLAIVLNGPGITPQIPEVSIHASDANAGEFGNDQTLEFTVTRNSPSTATLNVPIIASGSATEGTDYTGFQPSLTLPAGQTHATMIITVLPDHESEGTETLTITLGTSESFTTSSPASAHATIADKPDQSYYFDHISDPDQRTASDNADGDNYPNIIEYFMGTLPDDANSRSVIEIPLKAHNQFTVRYSRAKDRTDVTGVLEWATDLRDWYTSGQSNGHHSVTFNETVVSNEEINPETVEVTATISGTEEPPSVFVRLVVQ